MGVRATLGGVECEKSAFVPGICAISVGEKFLVGSLNRKIGTNCSLFHTTFIFAKTKVIFVLGVGYTYVIFQITKQ